MWQPNDRIDFAIGSIGDGPFFFELGARKAFNQFLGGMNFIPHLEVVHDFWWAIAGAIIFLDLDIKSQNNLYLFTYFIW